MLGENDFVAATFINEYVQTDAVEEELVQMRSEHFRSRDHPLPPSERPQRRCTPGLMHGRTKDLKGFHPGASLNNGRQHSSYLRICFPVIRLRILGGLPQIKGLGLSSIQAEKSDLLQESPLLPKQGNNFSFNFQFECQDTIILQVHIQLACEHNTRFGFVAKERIPGACSRTAKPESIFGSAFTLLQSNVLVKL
jgi:hypothetical protein